MSNSIEDGRLRKYLDPGNEGGYASTVVGSGFNATGYRVSTGDTVFFARSLNPSPLANVTLPDQIKSSMESSKSIPHGLPSRTLAFTKDGEVYDLSQVTDVINVGNILPEGYTSFLELLRQPTHSREELTLLTQKVKAYALRMAEVMADIHNSNADINSQDLRRDLYSRATRAIIHNDELTAGVIDLIDLSTTQWITSEDIDLFLSDMRKTRVAMGNNPERLARVHGDFWAANLFIHPTDEPLTGDTRITYGEPGVDAGWMIGEFLLQDLVRFGKYGHDFTKIVEQALQQYQQLRDDPEITRYMSLGYGFQAFAEAVFTPNLSDAQRRTLFATAIGVLDNAMGGNPLQLKEMNTYKERGESMLTNK